MDVSMGRYDARIRQNALCICVAPLRHTHITLSQFYWLFPISLLYGSSLGFIGWKHKKITAHIYRYHSFFLTVSDLCAMSMSVNSKWHTQSQFKAEKVSSICMRGSSIKRRALLLMSLCVAICADDEYYHFVRLPAIFLCVCALGNRMCRFKCLCVVKPIPRLVCVCVCVLNSVCDINTKWCAYNVGWRQEKINIDSKFPVGFFQGFRRWVVYFLPFCVCFQCNGEIYSGGTGMEHGNL